MTEFEVKMRIESEAFSSAKRLTEAIEYVLRNSWNWTEIKEILVTKK